MDKYKSQREAQDARTRDNESTSRPRTEALAEEPWQAAEGLETERSKQEKRPGVMEEPATRTEGRSGESYIQIEWVDQWVGKSRSCYFNISTATDNELRAEVKQKAYKKSYAAVGACQTAVTPVAPIGTKGVLIVSDRTTGEKLEQPWAWVSLHGNGWLARLWRGLKGLFTNE